jgi:hypothetical protein
MSSLMELVVGGNSAPSLYGNFKRNPIDFKALESDET